MSDSSIADRPLVAVMGPTASGKSGLALRLAEEFDGEIVSVDSAQVYRGMDIGTAKPTPAEQRRVPHHLIDMMDPDQQFNLALFVDQARRVIEQLHHRRVLPFLVGGTGLYMRALLEGYRLPRSAPDPELRRRLSQRSPAENISELRRLDPKAADIVDLANPRRVQRALEVCLSGDRLFSQGYRKDDPGFQVLKLGLRWSRQQLAVRIGQRIEQMVAAGMVEEVRTLKEKGYAPCLDELKLIGYPEVLAYLEGRCDWQQTLQDWNRNTRRLSKRQETWLRRESDVHWLDRGPDGDAEQVFAQARELVARFRKET